MVGCHNIGSKEVGTLERHDLATFFGHSKLVEIIFKNYIDSSHVGHGLYNMFTSLIVEYHI